jgi:hypothetical protein
VAVSGDLPIHEVVATSGGTVTLRAAGAITVARQNASTFYEGLVEGGRIRLYADGGGIGQSTTRPLVIDSGVLPDDAPTISVPLDVIVHANGRRLPAGEGRRPVAVRAASPPGAPGSTCRPAASTTPTPPRSATSARTRSCVTDSGRRSSSPRARAPWQKIQETIDAFAANRQNEYRSYWLFRATQTDLVDLRREPRRHPEHRGAGRLRGVLRRADSPRRRSRPRSPPSRPRGRSSTTSSTPSGSPTSPVAARASRPATTRRSSTR